MNNSGTEDVLASYYNETPYESHPFWQTAPEHLQAVALLFGLEAPAVETARVLELGAAAGGNLLPFAVRHPNACAVGVDLSKVQIEDGKNIIARAGISNIELHCMDISNIDSSFGKFDYIICHGVYSWVPEHVQQAILRIASENLAENGLAYISYNTYPGWKSREIIRDAMIFHGSPHASAAQLPHARGMIEFLDANAQPNSVLKAALDDVRPLITSMDAYYLKHEFLEPFNAPCYFRDFLTRASKAGLAYVAESEYNSMFIRNYSENIRTPLMKEAGNSQVQLEQYLDFVTNRGFRQTILTHEHRNQEICRNIENKHLNELHFMGTFVCQNGPLVMDTTPQNFKILGNRTIALTALLPKALASIFEEAFPATLTLSELIEKAASKLNVEPAAIQEEAGLIIMEFLIKGSMRIRKAKPKTTARLPVRPHVPVAIRNLLIPPLGTETVFATNLTHDNVVLNVIEVHVARLLDGSRDLEEITTDFIDNIKAGQLGLLDKEGTVLTDSDAIEIAARHNVPLTLESLRRKGLILAERKEVECDALTQRS